MADLPLVFVGAVFTLAGFVKGVIGLGLPTVSMGLLAIVVAPAQAAALLLVPSVATNIWQAFVGPALRRLAARLWPMLAGVVVGTLLGTGWLTGPVARVGSGLLGVAIVIYASLALAKVRFHVPPAREAIAGPLVGLATGLLAAATGVFVIPAVPYLQALDLDKDEMVQALGLNFLVSTLALAANLWLSGAMEGAFGWPMLVALGAAFAGMAVGQAVRHRLSQALFRAGFLWSLLALGLYLAGRILV